MRHLVFASIAGLAILAPSTSAQAPTQDPSAADRHQRGVELHLQRRLDEASQEYARTLTQDPPRAPGPAELEIVRRFAPRVYVTTTEPFGLKDAAAILHPSERLIAYHLFWDDDIDFPDDNDPCDHEVVWVRYSADGRSLDQVWTYFHGRILGSGSEALDDARANGQRPRVNVQWGKHGSMPFGWQSLSITADSGDLEREVLGEGPMTLLGYNRGTWRKLSTEGRRAGGHPLARRLGWPLRFEGAFDRFVDFSRQVDLLGRLDERKLVAVSRWNSAVINQQFLAYNFRPKTEWPSDATPTGTRLATPAASVVPGASIETFQLPPRQVFDAAMPRYPNVWFYLDATLVPSYEAAVRLVAEELRGPMRLREYPKTSEGGDFEVRLEHLQPWEVPEHRALQHSHAFHMRYYHSALSRHQLDRVLLPTASGPRPFYRIAASAHYEVEHTNPHHADVELCPHCGRTGAYAAQQGSLVENVHDPLGLELLFDGTIRGGEIRFEDDQPQPFGGVGLLRDRYTIERRVFEAASGDRNTLRVGVLVIAPSTRR